MLVSAFVILGFPRELPGSQQMRQNAIKEGNLPKKDIKFQGKMKEIVPATAQLLKNPTFVFNTLALTAGSLFGGGIGIFIAKFSQLNYGINPVVAGLTLGIVFLLGASGESTTQRSCPLDFLSRQTVNTKILMSIIQ